GSRTFALKGLIRVGLGRVADPFYRIEAPLHEFNHWRQGADSQILKYRAKYPFYKLARRLSWIDSIPDMQTAHTRREFLFDYVESPNERESYPLGLLARIRYLANQQPTA